MLATAITGLLVLIILIMCLISIAMFQNNLPLNDPPGLTDRLKIYLTTNIAETSRQPVLPELEIRVYPLSIEQLTFRLKNTINRLGWKIQNVDKDENEIHAVVTSQVWHFRDDVMIRLQKVSDTKNAVYIRSNSRIGKGDLGTNSRHILDLYEMLDEEM